MVLSETLLIAILYVVILCLLIILIITLFRVDRMKKSINPNGLKASDVEHFLDEMRSMLIESQNISHHLEDQIRKKEAVLEDLYDVVEGKIKKLETLQIDYAELRTEMQKLKNDIQNNRNTNWGGTASQPQPANIPNVHYPTIEEETTTQLEQASSGALDDLPADMPLKEKIIALKNKGYSEADICKLLKVSVTEVQLVLKFAL